MAPGMVQEVISLPFLEGLSIRQINILKDDRETVCSVPGGVDLH